MNQTIETGAPNLDAMERGELMEFWQATNVTPVTEARRLFPERPAGYVSATKNLGHYAANKATAMRCRLAGRPDSALQYEAICDRIYSDLPEFARW